MRIVQAQHITVVYGFCFNNGDIVGKYKRKDMHLSLDHNRLFNSRMYSKFETLKKNVLVKKKKTKTTKKATKLIKVLDQDQNNK